MAKAKATERVAEKALQSSPIRERQGVRENNGGEDIDRVSQDDISPVCASKNRA